MRSLQRQRHMLASTSSHPTADLSGDLIESPVSGAQPTYRPRRWEQRQVQIKTMEGEFSVTMWASGTDDDADSNPEPDPDYTEYMSGRKIADAVSSTTF